MKKISVVIPVYNGEQFIGETIQSVLDQTFQDFEIVVVDDGSADRTQEIVGRFSGPISYHRQENRGAAQARNFGVTVSNGEWIAFLDADDLWYPEKLAIQAKYIEACPEDAFFYSDFDVIDEEGHITQREFLRAKLDQQWERMKLVALAFDGGPTPHPSTALLRKEAFLKVGGFNPLFRGNYYEDLEFFARLVRNFPSRFIPQSLAKYRVCSQRKEVPTSEDNWLILLDSLMEMWRDEPEKLSLLLIDEEKDFAKYYSRRGKKCLRSGDYHQAHKYLLLAFSHRPLNVRNLRRLMLSYMPGPRRFYLWWKKGKKPILQSRKYVH